MKYNSVEARFWDKVEVGSLLDCWNWIGPIKSTGRGNFSIGHKIIQAHRMAWILTMGNIPDGLCVLHHCDNGKCCNPFHLFLGTYQDNTDDMIKKGRKVTRRCQDDPKSKLTNAQVIEIRKKYNPKINTMLEIGKEYHVSRTTISAIIHRYNWNSI
jgi:hypothetical protein